MTTPLLQSRLRCPQCGYEADMTMPTNACVFFHLCDGCNALLRPSDGDCCVFCSYGSVSCPPVQDVEGDGGVCCRAAPRPHAGGT